MDVARTQHQNQIVASNPISQYIPKCLFLDLTTISKLPMKSRIGFTSGLLVPDLSPVWSISGRLKPILLVAEESFLCALRHFYWLWSQRSFSDNAKTCSTPIDFHRDTHIYYLLRHTFFNLMSPFYEWGNRTPSRVHLILIYTLHYIQIYTTRIYKRDYFFIFSTVKYFCFNLYLTIILGKNLHIFRQYILILMSLAT